MWSEEVVEGLPVAQFFGKVESLSLPIWTRPVVGESGRPVIVAETRQVNSVTVSFGSAGVIQQFNIWVAAHRQKQSVIIIPNESLLEN